MEVERLHTIVHTVAGFSRLAWDIRQTMAYDIRRQGETDATELVLSFIIVNQSTVSNYKYKTGVPPTPMPISSGRTFPVAQISSKHFLLSFFSISACSRLALILNSSPLLSPSVAVRIVHAAAQRGSRGRTLGLWKSKGQDGSGVSVGICPRSMPF